MSAAPRSAPAAKPRRPRTRGTSGSSKIMYCGESTLPNATKRQTAAAEARTSVSASRGVRASSEPDSREKERREDDRVDLRRGRELEHSERKPVAAGAERSEGRCSERGRPEVVARE